MTFPAPRIPEQPRRPTLEGSVAVRAGRRLSFAEYGSPRGPAIVWMHGTPGARRQIPVDARAYAEEAGVRIIGIDRPGIGSSTPHVYANVLDWTADLGLLLDALAVDTLRVIGLSGGGPYALAAGAALPERGEGVGVLGESHRPGARTRRRAGSSSSRCARPRYWPRAGCRWGWRSPGPSVR
ncbi:alpha/beta hydrolase [Nocardioides sp. LHD-245]|uniref:alpha/beta fold hydrolase n=1 Tax=Nocardioides sp. LHD-245 TaxID=3051387 RepID=UPI0027E17E6C|nr:alpha/beta hydrolase [Nocardioides sp. LHD-245]